MLAHGFEAARLREVHKYHDIQQRATPRSSDTDHRRPSAVNIVDTEHGMPDTALTAFLQLVTLRCDAQRAVISLVDKDDQVSWFPPVVGQPSMLIQDSISLPKLPRPGILLTQWSMKIKATIHG